MIQLAHTVPQACLIAQCGRTTLYQAIRSGALRAVKRGRRTLILDDNLRSWVQTLPSIAVKSVARSGTEGGSND
jgi:excisionase family DNA binding protein